MFLLSSSLKNVRKLRATLGLGLGSAGLRFRKYKKRFILRNYKTFLILEQESSIFLLFLGFGREVRQVFLSITTIITTYYYYWYYLWEVLIITTVLFMRGTYYHYWYYLWEVLLITTGTIYERYLLLLLVLFMRGTSYHYWYYLWEVLIHKLNLQQNKVVSGKSPFFLIGPFCTRHSICLNIGFWKDSFVSECCPFIWSTLK